MIYDRLPIHRAVFFFGAGSFLVRDGVVSDEEILPKQRTHKKGRKNLLDFLEQATRSLAFSESVITATVVGKEVSFSGSRRRETRPRVG